MAIVLIHGLFGWGEERPLFGLGPTYFPLQHLRKLWRDGPVVAVDVGIADSDHNRACEAFAQILGLRVDYGENHEEQSPRYGTIYESGLLDLWDAEHPVHLVGHSFGGNTAVTLFHMIAEDYWNVGSGPDWVSSVTCICSPLRGCSLPEAGSRRRISRPLPRPLLAFGPALREIQRRLLTLSRPLVSIHMDQWQVHQERPSSPSSLDFAESSRAESSPRSKCKALRRHFGHLSKTRLVAVLAGPLEPLAPTLLFQSLATVAAAAALGWLAGALLLWRKGQLLWEKLIELTSQGPLRRLAIAFLLWSAISPFIAAVTLRTPRLRRQRTAVGAWLQQMLEPSLPYLHGWLARPLLRICSCGVSPAKATALLPASDINLGNGVRESVHADEVVDLISQHGLDAPSIGTVTVLEGAFISGADLRFWSGSPAPSPLERLRADSDELELGKWHVIHVPKADHCLGTWLDPHHTRGMYLKLFSLLEGCTAHLMPRHQSLKDLHLAF